MPLREKWRQLSQSGFLRSVGILVGGTALAQGIGFAVLPVLTRLYSPEDFGVLTVYTSLLSVLSVVACLRFEVAIPLPEKDEDAASLLTLGVGLSVVISLLVTLFVLTVPEVIAAVLKQPSIQDYLWLLPLGVLGASGYNALQFWSTRRRRFSLIARTRVTQATGAASLQVGLGFAGIAPLGLLLGQVVNSMAGVGRLARDLWQTDRSLFRGMDAERLHKAWRDYSAFPRYSTWEALTNSASQHLPILLLPALTGDAELGFLFLAMRVMQMPMSFLGSAVSQVYLTRAPEEHRADRLGVLNVKILSALLQSGVGPLVFLGILAPDLLQLFFGQEWQRTGVLIAWMTPWSVTQFLAAPISMALHIAGKSRIALLLQIFGVLLRSAAVLGASGFLGATERYALSGGIFYFVYLAAVLYFIPPNWKDLGSGALRSGALVVGWAVLAGILRLILNHWF